MIDFLMIATRTGKRGVIEIYPKFIIKKSKDLMIRGSDFYAIWLEERGLWSIDEQDALQLIDHELDIYANEHGIAERSTRQTNIDTTIIFRHECLVLPMTSTTSCSTGTISSRKKTVFP